MTKPDWATGPEWDGWELNVPFKDSVWNMVRGFECLIQSDGTLELFNDFTGEEVTFPCKSPEAARKAAEALLEAME